MNILADVKTEKCFYCADGSVIHNLYELEKKLRTISPEAFYHHVTQSKNDFHNWIRDVLQDYDLANQVLRAKTPAAVAAAVRRHIRKTFLAEEEIENAIRKVVEEKKPAVKKLLKQKTKQPRYKKLKHRLKKSVVVAISARKIRRTTAKIKKIRKRQHGKNRKLNKKQNQTNKGQTGKGKRNSSARKRGKNSSGNSRRSSSKRKTGATASIVKKHIKKHMGQWLKWLSVNPKA